MRCGREPGRVRGREKVQICSRLRPKEKWTCKKSDVVSCHFVFVLFSRKSPCCDRIRKITSKEKSAAAGNRDKLLWNVLRSSAAGSDRRFCPTNPPSAGFLQQSAASTKHTSSLFPSNLRLFKVFFYFNDFLDIFFKFCQWFYSQKHCQRCFWPPKGNNWNFKGKVEKDDSCLFLTITRIILFLTGPVPSTRHWCS